MPETKSRIGRVFFDIASARIEDLKTNLASGAVADMQEYRLICGRIDGILNSMDMFADAEKRLEEEGR